MEKKTLADIFVDGAKKGWDYRRREHTAQCFDGVCANSGSSNNWTAHNHEQGVWTGYGRVWSSRRSDYGSYGRMAIDGRSRRCGCDSLRIQNSQRNTSDDFGSCYLPDGCSGSIHGASIGNSRSADSILPNALRDFDYERIACHACNAFHFRVIERYGEGLNEIRCA